MKRNKIVAVILSLVFVMGCLSFAGCSSSRVKDKEDKEEKIEEVEDDETSEETVEDVEETSVKTDEDQAAEDATETTIASDGIAEFSDFTNYTPTSCNLLKDYFEQMGYEIVDFSDPTFADNSEFMANNIDDGFFAHTVLNPAESDNTLASIYVMVFDTPEHASSMYLTYHESIISQGVDIREASGDGYEMFMTENQDLVRDLENPEYSTTIIYDEVNCQILLITSVYYG